VCCSVLQCVAECFSVLQCVAVCCSVLQCVAVCCSLRQCVAVCCGVLRCIAVCCGVLQCVAAFCSMLKCATACCSVLQCVAVCCRVLQCVAVCCSVFQCAGIFTVRDAPGQWQTLVQQSYYDLPPFRKTNRHTLCVCFTLDATSSGLVQCPVCEASKGCKTLYVCVSYLMRLPEVCPNAQSQTGEARKRFQLAKFCAVFGGVKPCGARLRKTMVLAGSPSPKSLATSPQRWTEVKISAKGDLGTGLRESRRLKRSL